MKTGERSLRKTRFALISTRPPTLLRVLASARPLRELSALPRTGYAASLPLVGSP